MLEFSYDAAAAVKENMLIIFRICQAVSLGFALNHER